MDTNPTPFGIVLRSDVPPVSLKLPLRSERFAFDESGDHVHPEFRLVIGQDVSGVPHKKLGEMLVHLSGVAGHSPIFHPPGNPLGILVLLGSVPVQLGDVIRGPGIRNNQVQLATVNQNLETGE